MHSIASVAKIFILMINSLRKQHRIRLDNLERLVTEAGSAKRLAELAHTSSSYLSQVRNRSRSRVVPSRGVGDDLASRLERAMDKPEGWMDESHEEDDSYPGKNDQACGVHRMCPLISWVQAGAWTEVTGSFTVDDAEAFLPCPLQCSAETFVLRVRGESMEPRFRDGDLIFVDPAVSPDHGRFVVVRAEDFGEATFKQLIIEGEHKYLKALNPDWPERIIESDSRATVCGVVVFKGEII